MLKSVFTKYYCAPEERFNKAKYTTYLIYKTLTGDFDLKL